MDMDLDPMAATQLRHVMYWQEVDKGESLPAVIVTHERNGYVVWTNGTNMGLNPTGFWQDREAAIEHAVDLVKHDDGAAGRW